MLAARKELSDFYETKRVEELTAMAYRSGIAEGREQVENEKQDKLENAFIAGILATLAVVGTCWFFASL